MGGVFLWPSSGPQSDLLFGDADWIVECHRLGNSVHVGAVLVLGWMRTGGSRTILHNVLTLGVRVSECTPLLYVFVAGRMKPPVQDC